MCDLKKIWKSKYQCGPHQAITNSGEVGELRGVHVLAKLYDYLWMMTKQVKIFVVNRASEVRSKAPTNRDMFLQMRTVLSV